MFPKISLTFNIRNNSCSNSQKLKLKVWVKTLMKSRWCAPNS